MTLRASRCIAEFCRTLPIRGKLGTETIPDKIAWFFHYLPLLRSGIGYKLYQLSVWVKPHEIDDEILRLPRSLSAFRPLLRPFIILRRRALCRRSARR